MNDVGKRKDGKYLSDRENSLAINIYHNERNLKSAFTSHKASYIADGIKKIYCKGNV